MKIRHTTLVLAFLAMLTNAAAQDRTEAFAETVEGTWSGEAEAPGGGAVRSIRLILNADGTGTLEVDSVTQELEDVVLRESMVTFSVRPLLGGSTPAPFQLRYEGDVEGDTMTLKAWIDDGSGSAEDRQLVVLTRKAR